MARGGRDWGVSSPSSYLFPIVSFEDYLMRLGLINTLDGKGDILFYDSFESGISKWHQTSGVGDNYIILSPGHARSGNWSLKLHLAGGAWDHTEAAITMPVDQPGRFGFESNFTIRLDSFRPVWNLYYYDIANYYMFAVRYNPATHKLQYHAPLDVWTNFADVTWEVSPLHYWHPVKLVIDATRLEYVKFIARGIEYDLTGYTTSVDVLDSRRAIQPRFRWQNAAGASYHGYLDDVIITTNEP